MSKDELREYEEELALKRASDMFYGGSITNSSQSWRTALLEAHVNALAGAPLAVIAHIVLLVFSGVEPNWDNAIIFATASWPVFFYISVGRVYVFRRIFEKYGLHLEPLLLYKKLKETFIKIKK